MRHKLINYIEEHFFILAWIQEVSGFILHNWVWSFYF